MHSWRVLILPYLGEQSLYNRYRFDEAWNGPNNGKLLAEMPLVYSCPSHSHHGDAVGKHVTNYMLITGPGTAFSNRQTTLDDITDGASRTAILTDVNTRSVPWMSPSDVAADDFASMTDTANHAGDIFVVGFADGHCKGVYGGTEPETLEAFTTIAGNDSVETTTEFNANTEVLQNNTIRAEPPKARALNGSITAAAR